MIEKIQAYKTTDGLTHSTVEDAKRHEVITILGIEFGPLLDAIIINSEAMIAILKLNPRKARTPKKVKAPKVPKVA